MSLLLRPQPIILALRRFESSHLKAINIRNTPKPGHVHNKKPFKYHCQAGRVYLWCSCGWSRTQPFCDGTHQNPKYRLGNRPFRFECTETGDYWFCQCKSTNNRPFCDGTHQLEELQTKTATMDLKLEGALPIKKKKKGRSPAPEQSV